MRHPIIKVGDCTRFSKEADSNESVIYLGPQLDEDIIVWGLSHEVNHWAYWYDVDLDTAKHLKAAIEDWLPEEIAANWGLNQPGFLKRVLKGIRTVRR